MGYLADISQISAGDYHTVALKSDGTRVYAWGYNRYGQLGDGTTTDRLTPIEVLGVSGVEYLTDISQISTGGYHAVALKSDGTRVYAWGYNCYGQLGDSTMTNRSTPVTTVVLFAKPFTVEGTFDAQTSTIEYSGTYLNPFWEDTVTVVASTTYYNLTISIADETITLTGDITIEALEIDAGSTMSTGGYLLSVVGDVVLQGILDAGSSTVNVSGNLITNSGGIIQGINPTLHVSGYIGTEGDPINNAVTGQLTARAGNMRNYLSIALIGRGRCSFEEPIPGFVMVNGNFATQIGQTAIRGMLTEGESCMYERFYLPQPIILEKALRPIPAEVVIIP